MLHLDKVRLYGKYIRVMQSKYQTVQLPKEGQPDSGLTKDYTSSPLHRFKKPGSKNYHNIYPPSSTLHLSNIPWAFFSTTASAFKIRLTIIYVFQNNIVRRFFEDCIREQWFHRQGFQVFPVSVFILLFCALHSHRVFIINCLIKRFSGKTARWHLSKWNLKRKLSPRL